jgi:hypothetical protein
MRLSHVILLMCLMPVPGAFCAEDTGDRGHPADDNPACLDRGTDSARGGCLTNASGALRDIAPLPLPPEPDNARQSPPGSAATPPTEFSGAGTGDRSHAADDNSSACLDRGTNSAGGGCLTHEDGRPLNAAPQALSPQ